MAEASSSKSKFHNENNRFITSDGSGSKFFGFGLRLALGFRVRVLSGFSYKKNSGLIRFGFNAKINFRVRV